MIKAYIDGACWPNPGGPMGIGGYLLDADEKEFRRFYKGFEAKRTNSNNVAEYLALLEILDELLNPLTFNGRIPEETVIYSDSQLLIHQMNDVWPIKIGKLYSENAIQAKYTLTELPLVRFQWIPRVLNTKADDLSKRGLIIVGGEDKSQAKKRRKIK